MKEFFNMPDAYKLNKTIWRGCARAVPGSAKLPEPLKPSYRNLLPEGGSYKRGFGNFVDPDTGSSKFSMETII